MRSHVIGATLLAAALAAGCDEEPLDLQRPGGDSGGVGAASGFDAARGGSGGGGDRPDGGYRLAIDEMVFAEVITPILDRRCSGAPCHGREPAHDARFQIYGSPDFPPGRLTPEQIAANLEDVVAFINFQDPPLSLLLRKATSDQYGEPPHFVPRPALLEQSEDYDTIIAWIESATGAPPPDLGVPDASPPLDAGDAAPPPPPPPEDAGEREPPPTVPCEALPDPRVRSRFDWVVFRAEIEPMLEVSCATGDCHGTPGTGGGLWIQTEPSVCTSRWNFFNVLWFVDPYEPAASQILSQPLGDADGLHGGEPIFAGEDDERYVLLEQWITEAAGQQSP